MSIISNMPMAELDNVKSMLRAKGQKFRIRYRGPRFGIPTDTRCKLLKQSTCLKVNATTFSVY